MPRGIDAEEVSGHLLGVLLGIRVLDHVVFGDERTHIWLRFAVGRANFDSLCRFDESGQNGFLRAPNDHSR